MELELPSVQRRFDKAGDEAPFRLNIPSIALLEGEVCYVMGVSGAGKSVYLESLALELRGFGRDKVRTAVGLLSQRPDENIAPSLTIRDNLRALASESGLRRVASYSAGDLSDSIRNPFESVLRRDTLRASLLSGGQRQLLAFHCLLSHPLDLLLLDEYTAATDREASRLLRRMCGRYCSQVGARALVVSHSIAEALESADRILLIRDGSIYDIVPRNSPRFESVHIAQFLADALR